MRVLVLGAGGMLGFAIHRTLTDHGFQTVGTVREAQPPHSPGCQPLLYLPGIDVNNLEKVDLALSLSRPEVVINAIVSKANEDLSNPRSLIGINAIFPRQLEQLVEQRGGKLIHFSTDSVYGVKGAPFRESDIPQPADAYAISKYLGEPSGVRALTFRLSLIGLGLNGNGGLLDWFFRQSGRVKGYSQAVFSGLPVGEMAKILALDILPRSHELQGIYNISAEPISKFALLSLVKSVWGLEKIDLIPDPSLKIDRSLCFEKLHQAINYVPSSWPKLIRDMKDFYDKFEMGGVK